MVLFDINTTQTIDLEKVEAIVMEMNFDSRDIKVMISGIGYLIEHDKHDEFFRTIQQLERGSSLSKQYVSV